MAKKEIDISEYINKSVKIYYPSATSYYREDLENGNTRSSFESRNSIQIAVLKPRTGRLIGYNKDGRIYLLGTDSLLSYQSNLVFHCQSYNTTELPEYYVGVYPDASARGNYAWSWLTYNYIGETGSVNVSPIGLDWKSLTLPDPVGVSGFNADNYILNYREDFQVGKNNTTSYTAASLTNDPASTPLFFPATGTDGSFPASMISLEKYPNDYPRVTDMITITADYTSLADLNERIYEFAYNDLGRFFKIDTTNRSIRCQRSNINNDLYGDLRYSESEVKALPTYIFNLIITNDLDAAQKYLIDGTIPDDATVNGYPGDDDSVDKPDTDGEDGATPDDVDEIPVTEPVTTSYALSDTHVYRVTQEILASFYSELWSLDFSSIVVNSVTGLYSNLIENVISLKWFPVKSSSIGVSVSNKNIVLGFTTLSIAGYVFDSNKVITRAATFNIEKIFNSYMDYAPYTQIQLYLPFHGFIDIDTNLFMAHSLVVDYTVDVTSGLLTYYISRDKTVIQQVQTTCAIEIPLTLSSAIDVAGQITQNIISKSLSAGTALATGNPIGAAGSVLGSTNAPPSKYIAGAGNNGALFGNRQVTLLIRRPQYNRAKNYGEAVGYPSFSTFKLSTLKGFVVVKNPKLAMTDKMTYAEYSEIISLLESGVYI